MADNKRFIENFSWSIALTALIIIAIGLYNLYSATRCGQEDMWLAQLIWMPAGMVVAMVVALTDYRVFERLAYPIYVIGVLLLVLVLFVGRNVHGSVRWLDFGFFRLQPSELMKVAVVFALAKYFHGHGREDGFRLRDLAAPFSLVLLPMLLILKQPDLGTALVILLLFFTLVLFIRLKLRSLLALLGFGLLTMPVTWLFILKDYQRERILTFLNPERDLLGTGWHARQSLFAVGSGGFLGKGFLKGTQTQLSFLPERPTDFVFSVFAEEHGFLGGLILMLLYTVLMMLSLRVAHNAKDRFGVFLAVGAAGIIFWHVVANIGMVVGVLPVVGMWLPLMSYGGSSVIIVMASLGILLSVSMHRFMF